MNKVGQDQKISFQFYLIFILFFICHWGMLTADSISLKKVGSGFLMPTDIQPIPNMKNKLAVLEKSGKAYILDILTGQKDLFMDISEVLADGMEEGLLGIAFPSDFSLKNAFYANYVAKGKKKNKTIIAEFHWKSVQVAVVKNPSRILLEVEQPYKNHNGGQIQFGPDGYLYVGFGDGGSRDDPLDHGQNTATFHGSLIRIDPRKKSLGKEYSIPTGNPILNRNGFLPEIWAYGLRNPWRFSFDKQDGSLFLADVGQDDFEEVNLIEKGGNYGWNRMEGFHCYKEKNCQGKGYKLPILEYSHKKGQSITGGYVYRGSKKSLNGKYFFGDFVSGAIFIANRSQNWQYEMALKSDKNISTFGQSLSGEIFLADFKSGDIFQIE